MTTVSVRAPAKVNLTLHITGQREDGYHLLDSLVVFAPVHDRLIIQDGNILSLTVEGPEAAGVPADMKNLALRAAELRPTHEPGVTLEHDLVVVGELRLRVHSLLLPERRLLLLRTFTVVIN